MNLREFSHMNTAELLDRVFDVYKKSFFPQVAFAAIVGVISFVVILVASVVVAFVAAFTIFMGLGYGYDTEFTPTMAFILIALVFAVILPLLVLWRTLVSSGHIMLAKQAFYGERVRLQVSRLPGTALRVISAIFAQTLLSIPFIAIIGGIAYVILTPDMVESIFSEYWMGGSALIANLFLVFVILITLVYVIYSNIFSLAVAAAVLEKQIFFGTVRRSWLLIKGDFWKILGVRLLWTVMILVLSYSAQGFATIIYYLVDIVFLGVHIPFWIDNLIMSVQTFIGLLLMFILGPLDGIMPAMIYFNQRIKKEGLDIEIQLERISHV